LGNYVSVLAALAGLIAAVALKRRADR